MQLSQPCNIQDDIHLRIPHHLACTCHRWCTVPLNQKPWDLRDATSSEIWSMYSVHNCSRDHCITDNVIVFNVHLYISAFQTISTVIMHGNVIASISIRSLNICVIRSYTCMLSGPRGSNWTLSDIHWRSQWMKQFAFKLSFSRLFDGLPCLF